MGALQQEFERIGNTTSIGSTSLADGGNLDVLADDSGSVIAQTLPPTGPTAANLCWRRHCATCSRDFFRQQRTHSDSKRPGSTRHLRQYLRSSGRQPRSEHGKPCLLSADERGG